MANSKIEQILEEYPYLRKAADESILLTPEEMDKYNAGAKVFVGDKNEAPVSKQLLSDLMQSDKYYAYVEKLFAGQMRVLDIREIINGDAGRFFVFNRHKLVVTLNHAKKAGELQLDKLGEERLVAMNEAVSFEHFKSGAKDDVKEIGIDKNWYPVSQRDIVRFITAQDKEYQEFFSKPKELYNGYPKEYFVYATVELFRNSDVFRDYIVPSEILDRFNDLASSKKIDIEALNKALDIDEEDEEYLLRIKPNPSLKAEITEGMPKGLTDVEKATYMYIKMCKLLTYDEEFYAMRQAGESARKHENLDNIPKIDSNNNEIVCYDFNVIFVKMLEESGIKFAIQSDGYVSGLGGGHANLMFRDGKFLVQADSVAGILDGDLARAKLNKPLNGLKCINSNEATKYEFAKVVSRVYAIVADQEDKHGKSLHKVEHNETFDEILSQYENGVAGEKETIDLNDKFEILLDKVKDANVPSMDSLAYVLQLRKVLFNTQECDNNFKVTFVKDNKPSDTSKLVSATAVFAINTLGFSEEPNQTEYYIYHPGRRLSQISQQSLEKKFDTGVFEYIGQDDPKIPNIDMGGEANASEHPRAAKAK